MSKFGIAQPVRRVEDRRLLSGAGCYVDDLRLDAALHAHVLRSPVARGAGPIDMPATPLAIWRAIEHASRRPGATPATPA